jgi:hypothetical protein
MKQDTHSIVTTVVGAIAGIFFFAAVNVCAQEIDACLDCHMDRNLTKTDAAGKVHSLYVDKTLFLNSVHGKNGYSCVDCHDGVEAKKHPAGGLPEIKCSSCHEEVFKEQEKSKHGQLLQTGNPYAPQCYDCHTMHAVMPKDDPNSSVNPNNLSITCGKCHEDEAKPAFSSLAINFVKGKEKADAFTLVSLLSPIATRIKGHGKVNMACDFSTKRCADCHFEATNHGDTEIKPKACVNCHEVEKSGFVFGKIHQSGVVTSPALSIMLVLLYLVGIGGILFYYKGDVPAKKNKEQKEEGA